MKTCTVIYNPFSSKYREKYLEQIKKELNRKGYNVKFINVNASIKISDLVKNQNNSNDLIITMGGDGTFGEAIRGFSSVEQSALYSHISTGTTNDVADNLGLIKNNPKKSLDLILSGKEQTIDTVTLNTMPFGYVSAFGYLSNVSYDTKNEFKYYLGHSAYFLGAIDEILKKPEKHYISYTVDGKPFNDYCLIGIVSNTKSFSGLNIYNDVDLNDETFETMIIRPIPSKVLLSLIKDYLTNKFDRMKYLDYIHVFQAKDLKINFPDSYPYQPINTDGDNSGIILNDKNKDLNYKIGKKIKMLIP